MSSKKKDSKLINAKKDVVFQCQRTPKMKDDGLTQDLKDGKVQFQAVKVLKDKEVPEKIRCGALITPPKDKNDKAVPY